MLIQLENSAKADDARFKKQEDAKIAVMAKYVSLFGSHTLTNARLRWLPQEEEITVLKARIDGRRKPQGDENGHDSSASLLFSVGLNEASDKVQVAAGSRVTDNQDQDPDTVEKVLETSMDLIMIPDSLPTPATTRPAPQAIPSPSTDKGKKRHLDDVGGPSVASNKRHAAQADASNPSEVFVGSTPLEGLTTGNQPDAQANKRQIKKVGPILRPD